MNTEDCVTSLKNAAENVLSLEGEIVKTFETEKKRRSEKHKRKIELMMKNIEAVSYRAQELLNDLQEETEKDFLSDEDFETRIKPLYDAFLVVCEDELEFDSGFAETKSTPQKQAVSFVLSDIRDINNEITEDMIDNGRTLRQAVLCKIKYLSEFYNKYCGVLTTDEEEEAFDKAIDKAIAEEFWK